MDSSRANASLVCGTLTFRGAAKSLYTKEVIVLITQVGPDRLKKAKRAFTTRRVPAREMQTLVAGNVKPAAGNLVLATVGELGKHRKIERLNGRRALMVPGNEIIVCYGNRYAPDQFEALVCDDLSQCHLVAGGGIAAREISRHTRMSPPTQIMPVGLIGNRDGVPLNIADYRVRAGGSPRRIGVILVVGTAMNAGKTLTAASLVCGLSRSGYRVAGIKATGTGSGGDLWRMKDMGADVVMDFTDAGFPSTYKAPDEAIERGVLGLIRHAERRKCDFAIVEIADGLQHLETATLLRSEQLISIAHGVVFAAYDSMGAKAGYDELRRLGYSVLSISGQITRSPLAMREAAAACSCPIHTPIELQEGSLMDDLSMFTTPVSTKDRGHAQVTTAIAPEDGAQTRAPIPDHNVVVSDAHARLAVRTQAVQSTYSLPFEKDMKRTG